MVRLTESDDTPPSPQSLSGAKGLLKMKAVGLFVIVLGLVLMSTPVLANNAADSPNDPRCTSVPAGQTQATVNGVVT